VSVSHLRHFFQSRLPCLEQVKVGGDEFTLRNLLLCTFLHISVTSFLSNQNISFDTTFSSALIVSVPQSERQSLPRAVINNVSQDISFTFPSF
jgi:hypothetical protein